MNLLLFYARNISLIFLFYFMALTSFAQQYDCSFKAPVVKIDFGVIGNMPDINLSSMSLYNKVYGSCPDDGHYSFSPFVSNCFTGHWFTLREDHTPGDASGMMMIVNAAKEPGPFFILPVNGLKGNTTYEISTWFVNVCKYGSECTATPPVINIKIETLSGKQLAKFNTGEISQTDSPNWQRYYGMFTMPANETSLVIKMDDITNGGCGNDFAMDDINIRECIKPNPFVKEAPKLVMKPAFKNIPPPANKTVVKQDADNALLIKPAPKNNAEIPKLAEKEKPAIAKNQIKARTMDFPVPRLIMERENPLVKRIETAPAEIVIDLYDNGEIDGDTVSIYHNNQLIVARAGLSEKPITFHIKIDEQHPHHEIIMVANNLGSIPPNTSLMVVTAMNKRYEVFISSSEQKNAKVVIDLKD